jgi:fucose permease
MGFGEVIGGALFPPYAGKIADHHGIPFMMLIAAIILAVNILLGFLLKETNPSVLSKKLKAKTAA